MKGEELSFLKKVRQNESETRWQISWMKTKPLIHAKRTGSDFIYNERRFSFFFFIYIHTHVAYIAFNWILYPKMQQFLWCFSMTLLSMIFMTTTVNSMFLSRRNPRELRKGNPQVPGFNCPSDLFKEVCCTKVLWYPTRRSQQAVQRGVGFECYDIVYLFIFLSQSFSIKWLILRFSWSQCSRRRGSG